MASTQMFGASAARPFDAANRTRIATNRRLRSTLASQAVRKGPHSMTTKANIVTNWPAVETAMPSSRASAGSRPTIRNSVVTITKAAMARIGMAAPPERGREGEMVVVVIAGFQKYKVHPNQE